MAVKFRNKLTGTVMLVADDRADEYRRLGFPEIVCGSVSDNQQSEKPVEKPVVKPVKEAVAKAPAKKAAAKTTAKKK